MGLAFWASPCRHPLAGQPIPVLTSVRKRLSFYGPARRKLLSVSSHSRGLTSVGHVTFVKSTHELEGKLKGRAPPLVSACVWRCGELTVDVAAKWWDFVPPYANGSRAEIAVRDVVSWSHRKSSANRYNLPVRGGQFSRPARVRELERHTSDDATLVLL